MNLSYNWLKELTGLKISPEKMAEILNLQVAAVEGIKKMGEGLDKVIVAEILAIKKHPQADKLQLVKVATKQFNNKTIEQFNIVCGAFNIKVGDKVPLALVGAKLPNGMEIKEAIIRGEKSNGMLCAEDELELGDDHTGILILDKSAKIGQKVSKVLGLDDVIIEIENVALTHRPDLFGHIGFAREISACLGQAKIKDKKQKIKNTYQKLKIEKSLKIKVEDYKDCSRYMGVVMNNIKVEPSPTWMKNRLRSLGIQPINNIVDITNYVLLETGQPLHAFDANKLAPTNYESKLITNKQIIIRRAKTNEKLLCLDGVERKLDKDILVIADKKKPIALAGIIGGEESGITDQTKTIVIESANFNPVVIRKGAKKVGLRTEANLRFEKNLPLIFAEQGIFRAVELIEKIANGKVVSKIYDQKNKETEKSLKTKKVINLEIEKIFDLIGEKISERKIIKDLTALGFVIKKTSKFLRLVVPLYRNDIELPEDVIEEIARIYSYQKITPRPIQAKLEIIPVDSLLGLERKTKNILTGVGVDEVYNYSFYGENLIDLLGLEKKDHLELVNPLNSDQTYLRISLLPKLLENAVKNISNFESFRIFEIGHIYRSLTNAERTQNYADSPRQSALSPRESALPVGQEKYLAGLILERNKRMFYLVKGLVETILEKTGIESKKIAYQLGKNPNYQYFNYLTEIILDNKVIGVFGELNEILRNNLKISNEVGVFEINLKAIKDLRIPDKIFEKISVYPSIIRDLAFLVPKNIIFKEILETIKNFHPLIYSLEPFDIFESEKIGRDVRSIAFRLVFQSFDRTLRSEEVDKIINDLVKILETKHNVKLRNF